MSIQTATAPFHFDSFAPDDPADLIARLQAKRSIASNEKFVAGQRDAFELAMKGAPIVVVLDRIVQIAREIFGADDGARAAIFTVDADGAHLRFGVAADMSEAYTRAVDGMAIGPHNPSCGTVAFTGETVVVADVAADPLWAPYLPLARAHHIHACWSFPIRAVGGKVLGTLAVYHRAPREPEPRHLEFIGLLAQTAAVILERHRLTEERLRDQEKLRQSEARFRALFNEVPVAIYSCDREGLIDELNPLAVELWGRTPARENPDDRFCGSHKAYLLDGTYMSHEQTPVVAVLNGDLPAVRDAQVVLERPDGSRITVVANIVPLKNELGDIIGAMNCFYDITERKQAEEALRASEERYRNLFNSIDEGFCVLEIIFDKLEKPVDYSFLEVNPTFERQSGIRGATGKRARELFPNLEQHWFETYGKVVRTGEPARLTIEVKELNRWLDLYACRVGGPQSRKVAVICSDVTERMQAEQELLESKRFLRSSLDAMTSSITVLDQTGVIMAVNESWRKFAEQNCFAGVAHGVGSNYLDACGNSYVKSADGPRIADEIRDVIAGRRELFEAEYPCHSPSERRWFLMQVTRFQGPGATRVVIVHENITERKRAEEALTEARNAAEAANTAKDKFLAVLSHELRTPLTPVVMTLAALEMNSDLTPAVRADLRMIQRNVDLETKLIDDLLDLSRITSGKLRLQFGTVDVNELLRHVCDICRSNIREKSIRLHCDLDDDARAVIGDPGRLQQVFWNLLNNSTKFTPEGGHIYIDTDNAPGGRLRIRVRDTGIGIPPQTLPHVFDAFEQGDVRVAQFGGMGLGLAICKALVEQHKGSISAETGGTNKGSTFVVDLPSISPEQAARTLAQSLPHAGEKGMTLRVLIVEDHADTAKVLARLLTAAGHAVMTATTVAGALSLAGMHPFDIVVSDLGLPDATGYDLMKQIKHKYGIKGIAMSGYGMEEDLRKSELAGFSDHLVKPVNMERLERAIREVVQNGALPEGRSTVN